MGIGRKTLLVLLGMILGATSILVESCGRKRRLFH